jgi:hypothetical protein
MMLSVLNVFLLFEKNSGHWNAIVSIYSKKTNRLSYISLNRSQIHIAVVSDENAQRYYQQHGKTVLCYAHRQGYHFTFLDPNIYYRCSSIVNFFFRKHCSVMMYLIQNPDIQWLLVLDGDTFVVNATKTLESFIPKDPLIHVVHYERFWYNEIMAGNYLIRNHPWSLLYLQKWVEFFKKVPKAAFHNHDNGALHLHFLDMVGKLHDEMYQTCLALYKKARDVREYMIFVSCTKCVLRGQKLFAHVILHRRGHSFCRDTMPENKIHQFDFMIHGYKGNPNDFFDEPGDSSTCINDANWTPKIRQSLIVSDLSMAKKLMREWDELASTRNPESVAYPDIADCWPHCEPEITGAKLDSYTAVLCNYTKFL